MTISAYVVTSNITVPKVPSKRSEARRHLHNAKQKLTADPKIIPSHREKLLEEIIDWQGTYKVFFSLAEAEKYCRSQREFQDKNIDDQIKIPSISKVLIDESAIKETTEIVIEVSEQPVDKTKHHASDPFRNLSPTNVTYYTFQHDSEDALTRVDDFVPLDPQRITFANFVHHNPAPKTEPKHFETLCSIVQGNSKEKGLSSDSVIASIQEILESYINRPSLTKNHTARAKPLLGKVKKWKAEYLPQLFRDELDALSELARNDKKINTEGSYFDLLNFSVQAIDLALKFSEESLQASQQIFKSKIPAQNPAEKVVAEPTVEQTSMVRFKFGNLDKVIHELQQEEEEIESQQGREVKTEPEELTRRTQP